MSSQNVNDAPWGDWDSLSEKRPEQTPVAQSKPKPPAPSSGRPEPTKFAKGDRVRHRVNGKLIGSIVSKAKFRGDWLVKWDNDPNPKDRLVPMHERELMSEIVDKTE